MRRLFVHSNGWASSRCARRVVMRRGSTGCVVPLHAELKVGTLAGVLRQAEISPEEFIKAL